VVKPPRGRQFREVHLAWIASYGTQRRDNYLVDSVNYTVYTQKG